MADHVLSRIAAAKRAELSERYHGVSLDALRGRARPTARSLAEALARPGARFVLEIKKASPSAGAIRPGADPAAIARGYAGVADALSVLCDAEFFGGSLDDLAAARAEFDGPILAKDFFIDPRQVAEARIAGADAVLVMMSLLDDGQARLMIDEARRLNMDALVEVHGEGEMCRALALDAGLIASAQAVEHYEITRYGTLKRWAEVLGMSDAAKLLDATLQEEAKTDEALTALADASANQQAVAAE